MKDSGGPEGLHRATKGKVSRRRVLSDSKTPVTTLHRVQVELDPAKVEELDLIGEKVGIRTRRELFDNALSLFARAVAASEQGQRVAFIDEINGRYIVLSTPALDAAFRSRSDAPPPLKKVKAPSSGSD